MKKALLVLAVLTMAVAVPQSAKAYDFPYTHQGQTLYYSLKTVGGQTYAVVTYPNTDATAGRWEGFSLPAGLLAIPDTVEWDNVRYAVKELGSRCFERDSVLTSVVIPEGVTVIGDHAFGRCTQLASVAFPNTLDSIGKNAFSFCSELDSVVLPDNLHKLEYGVFGYCTHMRSIHLPAQLEHVGQAMFYAAGLESVEVPEGVTFIDTAAFYLCTNLQSVTLPSTLTRIAYYAFNRDTMLTAIVLPQSVSVLESSVFGRCYHLTTVTMPDNMTFMGRYCFNNCYALTSIVVPEGITVIDTSTFADNYALRRVHLPSTLQTIKYHGFNECMAIDTITLACAVPPTVADSAIDDHSAMLIVPCGSANTYRQHEVWGFFANIVENCDAILPTSDLQLPPSIYVRDGRIIVDGAGDETVQVYDTMGRLTQTFKQSNNQAIPTGVYLVKVGNSAARKVVIMR